MKLTVRVFGRVSEEIGEAEFSIENTGNVSSLRDGIIALYPAIKDLKFAIAINHQLATDSDAVPEGAEVALLPPYSGG
ncbi:MoaD/ThiS family protein [Belliella marina]|uniref:MoaD/ThiS family protein n=1 Tax=Belliella marina TaxID=1644146 RepID=A0ABW4VUN7_9BACT